MRYKIIVRPDIVELEREVNKAIVSGWKPQGGPFLEPYITGYGNVLSMPIDPNSLHDQSVYVNFCQALVGQ